MKNDFVQECADFLARDEAHWLEDVIVTNTPKWAHALAQASMWRGLRWMHTFPLPLVRRLVQVRVVRESKVEPAGKGFRPGTMIGTEIVSVYKGEQLIAKQTFRDGRFSRITR